MQLMPHWDLLLGLGRRECGPVPPVSDRDLQRGGGRGAVQHVPRRLLRDPPGERRGGRAWHELRRRGMRRVPGRPRVDRERERAVPFLHGWRELERGPTMHLVLHWHLRASLGLRRVLRLLVGQACGHRRKCRVRDLRRGHVLNGWRLIMHGMHGRNRVQRRRIIMHGVRRRRGLERGAKPLLALRPGHRGGRRRMRRVRGGRLQSRSRPVVPRVRSRDDLDPISLTLLLALPVLVHDHTRGLVRVRRVHRGLLPRPNGHRRDQVPPLPRQRLLRGRLDPRHDVTAGAARRLLVEPERRRVGALHPRVPTG
mmetsp:Transcript_15715/g.36596  ORF Transcript_15715/g.36596 Transcript_15715/m.36596 type:complete len:311 (+) Transcript_15715:540-1472(+)